MLIQLCIKIKEKNKFKKVLEKLSEYGYNIKNTKKYKISLKMMMRNSIYRKL